MPAYRLVAKLFFFYGAIVVATGLMLWLFPDWMRYLPIGRVQSLIAEADGATALSQAGVHKAGVMTFGGSIAWMFAAVVGAILAALPVSWVYMEIRNPNDYDQSLIDTIVVLPLVVTSIVVIVQNSLALSFSLAGIAGAARYRNTLKSSGDLLFILLSIGIGLAAGIGAVELAIVSSAAFNFCFVLLWSSNYGERKDMKRFLSEFEHGAHAGTSTVTATVATATVTEFTETFETRPGDGPDKV